ncbi:MAG: FAD:protein FMN transferase [Bacteroidales bacterium]|nr:FAD:protein FMN transferase [Bacteroidales bacterium]
MKFRPFFLLCTLSIALLYSCQQENIKPVKFAGETQGTYYAITYYSPDGKNYQVQIDSLLKAFDQSVSMWVPNSIISRINRDESGVEPDEIFIHLFNRSKQVFEETGGAFDPTVGPLVNAWGFGFKDRMKVNQHVVDSLFPLIGFQKVTIQNSFIEKAPGVQFDFNAIAQGYSVDLIGKFLEKKGVKNYLIDIGGEVLGRGQKPGNEFWKVGIEKPSDNAGYGEGLNAIVELKDKALATSGNYRKFYEENGIRYSHTIDPKTGYPVQHTLLSVSVLAVDCTTADAFATAFMVLGIEKSKEFLQNRKDLEAYFIFHDKNGNLETYYTNGFNEIVTEEMD